MPDPFAALDDLASGAVEAAFGIEIVIQPRLPGSQYVAAGPDPARPKMRVRAIFSSGPAIDTVGGQGMAGASGGTTKIGGQTLVVWLSPRTMRSIPYALRKDDGVVFVDEPGLTYEITGLRPTNAGDLELIITRE